MRGWAAALRRSSWPRAWSHWIRVGWMPWTVRQCSRIWRWPTSWQGRDGRPSISSNGSCRCPRVSLPNRSEEHTSELQSQSNLVCRLLLEKKNPTLPPILAPPDYVAFPGIVNLRTRILELRPRESTMYHFESAAPYVFTADYIQDTVTCAP